MNPSAMVTVLVVDNDFSVRAGLRTYLAGEGFQIVEAGEEETAWQMAVAHAPAAAIVDIALPSTPTTAAFSQREESCGLHLAARLKKANPALGLVFYSAYPEYRREVVDLIHAYHRGVVYKLKGCLPSELVTALRAALLGGVAIDPEVIDPPSLAHELLERLAPDEKPWVEQALEGLERLTSQEKEVVRRMAASQNTQGIATALGITSSAVENHIGRLYMKLGLSDLKTEAPQLRSVVILTKAWMIKELWRGEPL